MNAREAAKIKMYTRFSIFLLDNLLVFTANKAFKTEYDQYLLDVASVLKLAEGLSVDNKVYSEAKLVAKQNMAQVAADLSGFAFTRLNKLGKTLEAGQLHKVVTDYMSLADPEAKVLASSTHTLLGNVIADLQPDYVTTEELNNLKVLTDKFNNTEGTSSSVQVSTPEDRKEFKKAILDTDTSVAGMLSFAPKFRTSNLSFYNELFVQSSIPTVSVHHTNLSVTVKGKADNMPIAGATASLSNSKKTAISDDKGFITIEQIAQGNPTLTVKANGLDDYTSLVHIISGHDNHFDILM